MRLLTLAAALLIALAGCTGNGATPNGGPTYAPESPSHAAPLSASAHPA